VSPLSFPLRVERVLVEVETGQDTHCFSLPYFACPDRLVTSSFANLLGTLILLGIECGHGPRPGRWVPAFPAGTTRRWVSSIGLGSVQPTPETEAKALLRTVPLSFVPRDCSSFPLLVIVLCG